MRLLVLLVSLFLSPLAVAQTYFGLGLSNTDYGVQNHGSGTGFKVTIGKQINKFVSLEAAYADYGSTDGTLNNGQDSQFEASSIGSGLKLAFPINSPIDLYLKGGVMRWRESIRYDRDLPRINSNKFVSDDAKLILYYSVGASYLINKRLRMFAEYQNQNRSGSDDFSGNFLGTNLGTESSIGSVIAGMEFRFGS